MDGIRVLRGRHEIAKFIGLSLSKVDKMIDERTLAVVRGTPGSSGLIITTTRLVIEAIEKEAKQQQNKVR